MKRITYLSMLLVLIAAACSPAAVNSQSGSPKNAAVAPANSSSPHTYTVLVGLDDKPTGAAMDAYFPATIQIHVGDTVVWKKNSNEIHTVTFLANMAQAPALMVPMPNAPQGAMMINPVAGFPSGPKDGNYDGTTYANSGIIGPDQGQAQQFTLTFTKAGTYNYNCIVHGVEMMNGSVVVVDASVNVPTQAEDTAQGTKEMDALRAQIPAIANAATAEIPADVKNPDGTTTHFVLVGYTQGQIDLDFYFPQNLAVNVGDTVTWTFSKQDVAPHTVTFLNGATAPAAIKPIPQPGGPPLLTFDPLVAMPQNAGKPLTATGLYSSGIMDPSAPGPHQFSLLIGDASGTLAYQCILHDDLGMTGTLTILAKP